MTQDQPIGANQVIHIRGISGTGAVTVCRTLIASFNPLTLLSSTKSCYSECSIPTNMEGN